MGRIPDDTEKPFIEYQKMRFYIEEIENKRIQRVRLEHAQHDDRRGVA